MPSDALHGQSTVGSCSSEEAPKSTFHRCCAFAGDTTNRDPSVAVMLQNTVEALEGAGARLQHVYFAEGIKYYGA